MRIYHSDGTKPFNDNGIPFSTIVLLRQNTSNLLENFKALINMKNISSLLFLNAFFLFEYLVQYSVIYLKVNLNFEYIH